MKTPAQLIEELRSILFDIENDDMAVQEYGKLFAILTSGPSVESAKEGMNRMSWVVVDHGRSISTAHDRMREIVRRLANP